MRDFHDPSPAWDWLHAAASAGVDVADALAELTPIELAALAYDWSWWGRSKQIIRDGTWRSHGTLAGRGWGKTVGNVAWIVGHVLAGDIRRINLIGPTDEEAYVVGFEDPFAGLAAWSPPWCKPTCKGNLIAWPNGAECRIFGAYKPDRIRGGGLDAVWCTELQSWPAHTAVKAWDMAVIKTREGHGDQGCKIVWDATSEHRNALLADRIRESIAAPETYQIVRGDTRENTALPAHYVADLLSRYCERDESGRPVINDDGSLRLTKRGEEEIAASYSLDATGALWKTDWIRHKPPAALMRRVISVDPAFSSVRHSDTVGLCDAGLDEHGQFVVLGDYSSKYRWEDWGDLAIRLYLEGKCDCLVVERNKAGDAVAANIRARVAAMNYKRGREDTKVVVLEKTHKGAPPRHDPRTIYVREITARDSKWNRAEPVAGLYQAGMAYHVPGEALRHIELTMTTWEPGIGVKSPGDLDALTQAAHELCDLAGEMRRAPSIMGIARAQKQTRVAALRALKPGRITSLAATGWMPARI